MIISWFVAVGKLRFEGWQYPALAELLVEAACVSYLFCRIVFEVTK